MNKTRNWFGASALIGSLGMVILANAMPKPAMSQSLTGSDSLYFLGGGGGGGRGGDGSTDKGGDGTGSYVGLKNQDPQGKGTNGGGVGGGTGGAGGANASNGNSDIKEQTNTLGTNNSYFNYVGDGNGLSNTIDKAGNYTGVGGNGGSVDATLKTDLTIKDLILKAGDGGNAGDANVNGVKVGIKGGDGGSVSFNAADKQLTVKETLQVTSGNNGSKTSQSLEQGKGGNVSFSADKLIVTQDNLSINLTKNDGALNFNVGTLDASSHGVKINLEDTDAGLNGSGVTFGDLIIGISKRVDITGTGDFTVNNLTVGGPSQTPFTSSAIINSEKAISFDSNSTLTFYLPENIGDGTILLQNTGSAITLSGSKIDLQIAGQHLNTVNVGDTIYLISGNVDGYIDSTTHERTVQGYGAREWTFDVGVADGSLIATSVNPAGGDGGNGGNGNDGGGNAGIINQEKAKSYFQSNAASLNALNFSSDQVASQDDFVVPVRREAMIKNVELVALLQHAGYGERVETGSSIKNNGMNLLGGLGVRINQQNGVLLANAFVEHGESDYDTFTSVTHGYGDTQYTGGGIYGKQSWHNGYFIDGSYRMGKLKSNYNSMDLVDGDFADAERNYYGWHVSVGKYYTMSPVDATVIYGRVLDNTIDNFTITNHAGEKLAFDKANSFRSVIGARYEHAMSEYAKLYAGAAWEHEWDGKTGGTLDGTTINAPDFSGASAVFEFGGRFEAVPNMPGWTANAAIRGVTGKRDEMSGKVGVGYRF